MLYIFLTLLPINLDISQSYPNFLSKIAILLKCTISLTFNRLHNDIILTPPPPPPPTNVFTCTYTAYIGEVFKRNVLKTIFYKLHDRPDTIHYKCKNTPRHYKHE